MMNISLTPPQNAYEYEELWSALLMKNYVAPKVYAAQLYEENQNTFAEVTRQYWQVRYIDEGIYCESTAHPHNERYAINCLKDAHTIMGICVAI